MVAWTWLQLTVMKPLYARPCKHMARFTWRLCGTDGDGAVLALCCHVQLARTPVLWQCRNGAAVYTDLDFRDCEAWTVNDCQQVSFA